MKFSNNSTLDSWTVFGENRKMAADDVITNSRLGIFTFFKKLEKEKL